MAPSARIPRSSWSVAVLAALLLGLVAAGPVLAADPPADVVLDGVVTVRFVDGIDGTPLTDATVIVEAGEQSGTMYQAWEAIRLDRPLFLLKSVADDAALTWPAKIIEYGAQVLSDDSLQPLIDNLPMATAFDEVAAAF